MAEIAVLGSLNMDLVAVAPRLPAAGETIIGARYFNAHGGKGANQAFAAARLGGDVAMIGRIGRDHHGAMMRDNLAQEGCDVSGVRFVDCASGVAVIHVAESGQNSIVVVPGANRALTPESLAHDAHLLNQARFLLMQLESPVETVIAAARQAKANGATIILDPAPAIPALPAELLAAVDILTPNETEAAILAGAPCGDLSFEGAAAIAADFNRRGVKAVIVKMGARGCLLSCGPQTWVLPAPAMAVVDTTAAGDVFNAALAVALAEGAELEQAAGFAVRASALSVTRYGAQPSTPTRPEVAESAPFDRVCDWFRVEHKE